MTDINWDLVNKGLERDHSRMIWKPYGAPTVLDLEKSAFHDSAISEPWKEIPEKLIVSVAITGAFFRESQNAHQPISPNQILESARSVASAGASSVHIHVRDDAGFNVLSPERFSDVIVPLRSEFPDLPIDGCLVCALPGEFDKMRDVLEMQLLDASPVNSTATYVGDSLFAKPAPLLIEKTRLLLEHGCAPEIAVYTDADVSNADRFLLRSGLVQTPAVWIILPALPGCSPMSNPRQMLEGLVRLVGAVRDVDPTGVIFIAAAGRASMYLATLAAIMGLHIRVGMEDTYFKWPHRDDRIDSNLEVFGMAQEIASITGRPIATAMEARSLMGLPKASLTHH